MEIICASSWLLTKNKNFFSEFLENEGSAVLRNAGNGSPSDAAPCSRNMKSATLPLCNLKHRLIPRHYELFYHAGAMNGWGTGPVVLEEEHGFRFRCKVLPGLTIVIITLQNMKTCFFDREILLFSGVSGATVVVLDQCFSTFVRPLPGKFFFYKTRARSQQIYS